MYRGIKKKKARENSKDVKLAQTSRYQNLSFSTTHHLNRSAMAMGGVSQRGDKLACILWTKIGYLEIALK